jgi:hypothetical protein
MTLKLTNNVTKNIIEIEVEDNKNSTLFYQFDIQLPEGCEDGEYTYELINSEFICDNGICYGPYDKVIATGLLQIGDYQRDLNINREYNENNKNTIVYNG